MSFPDSLTTKELAYRRVILKELLRLYIEHSTIEEGLSLADVSTSLNSSRAQTEAVVETLLSEGYLYSTIDDEHHQTTVSASKRAAIIFVASPVKSHSDVVPVNGSTTPNFRDSRQYLITSVLWGALRPSSKGCIQVSIAFKVSSSNVGQAPGTS